MRRFASLKHIGDQHRIVETLHDDAMAFHEQIVIFEILRDLQHGLVFKQVLETDQCFVKGHLAFGEPDTIAE